MVPPYSHRVSRVRRYSGYSQRLRPFAYGTLTLYGVLSHTLRLDLYLLCAVRTPKVFLPSVWPAPRSLATTYGISVDVFSSPYLDVSVQAVPHVYLFDSLYVDCLFDSRVAPFGNPWIITLAYNSPWLIAVNHVLRRLLMPRHSPCALYSLT